MKTPLLILLAIALAPGIALTQNQEPDKERKKRDRTVQRENQPGAAPRAENPAPPRPGVQAPRGQAPQQARERGRTDPEPRDGGSPRAGGSPSNPGAEPNKTNEPAERSREMPRSDANRPEPASPESRPAEGAGSRGRDDKGPRTVAPTPRDLNANDASPATPAMPARDGKPASPATPASPSNQAKRDNPDAATPATPGMPARDGKSATPVTPASPSNQATTGEPTGRMPNAAPSPSQRAGGVAERETNKDADGGVRAARQRVQESRTQARSRAGDDTRRVLSDRARGRDFRQERERAREIDDDDDAKTILYSVLGGAAAGAVAGSLVGDRDRHRDGRYYRLPPEQVGRDPRDREHSVTYLQRRFRGNASWDDAPLSWRYYDRGDGYPHGHRYQPHYFNGNRRVVYYDSYDHIPAVLLASRQLNRLQVTTVSESPYRLTDAPPVYTANIPDNYRANDAYAVSYEVDPDSAVILDDILFVQGTTDFADAYSYDLVADLADAMNSQEVSGERFIVEGHASAEGDYAANLELSQRRAERIARDLVGMGVGPDRLVPVGYGETEARVPESANEEQRALDRRVMVFRLTE